MTHRLETLLGQARGALLGEDDLDEGIEKAVDMLLESGVGNRDQREPTRRALQEAVGLALWRQRSTALAQADSALDTAAAALESIAEDDLSDRVHGLLREVQDLLPLTDDMPREEIVGLPQLVEVFPGLLMERLLAARQQDVGPALAAG